MVFGAFGCNGLVKNRFMACWANIILGASNALLFKEFINKGLLNSEERGGTNILMIKEGRFFNKRVWICRFHWPSAYMTENTRWMGHTAIGKWYSFLIIVAVIVLSLLLFSVQVFSLLFPCTLCNSETKMKQRKETPLIFLQQTEQEYPVRSSPRSEGSARARTPE